MKKVKFKTMLGDTVSVAAWMLEKAKVEEAGKKFFGFAVTAKAGVYGNGNIGAGWQCRDAVTEKVVGYLSLSTGQFHWLDDYEYGIIVFVPFCECWAEFPYGKMRYIDEKNELDYGLS